MYCFVGVHNLLIISQMVSIKYILSKPPNTCTHHPSLSFALIPSVKTLLLSSLFKSHQVDSLVQMLKSVMCLSLSLYDLLGYVKMGLSKYTFSMLKGNVSDLYEMPCHTGLELAQIFTKGPRPLRR